MLDDLSYPGSTGVLTTFKAHDLLPARIDLTVASAVRAVVQPRLPEQDVIPTAIVQVVAPSDLNIGSRHMHRHRRLGLAHSLQIIEGLDTRCRHDCQKHQTKSPRTVCLRFHV